MKAARHITVEDRFWSKVDKTDGCWNFTGSFYKSGYGAFSLEGRTRYAHRLAWTWSVGEIPAGLFVCHHCDNRRCVRPDHLFIGTAKDNSQDMARKGRGRKPAQRGAITRVRVAPPICVDDVVDGSVESDFDYIDSIVSVRSRWGR